MACFYWIKIGIEAPGNNSLQEVNQTLRWIVEEWLEIANHAAVIANIQPLSRFAERESDFIRS